MWDKWDIENWQREQVPRKSKVKGGEEYRNFNGMAPLWERVGEDWRKRAANRRNWRLLIENVMTEKWQEEKRQ